MAQTPSTETKALLSAVAALLSGVWGGFHPLIQALVVLILLDLVSGILLALSTGTISSQQSFRGMVKKAMMLILVGAASAYNATSPLGFDAPAAVAGFFCTTEFISIIENAGRLGLPVGPLVAVITKLKREEK